MKYIVLRTKTRIKGAEPMIREFPIIFPDALTHADVAASLALHCPELKGGTPVAAGFMSSLNVGDRGACRGKSESLGNLQSRGLEDDTLMSCWDYLHGMVD